MIKHISKYLDNRPQSKEPLMSGYDFINNELGGYHPGELMTICGVENCGKTAFIVSEIDRLAIGQHIPTLIAVGLMDMKSFVASMTAYHYDIETNDFWGLWDDLSYQDEIGEYESLLREAPIYIMNDELHDDNWDEKLSEWIIKNGIRIAFVEDLEMITFDDSVSKLKKVAMESDITIVRTDLIYRNIELPDSHVTLAELNFRRYEYCSSSSDTVIAFNDYDYMKIFTDERGISLRGVIGIEILKQKGTISKKSYRLLKNRLYFRTRYSDSRYDVPESRPVAKHM